MRHKRTKRTLGLTEDHRRSLLANMVCSLVEKKRIQTTRLRAKEAGRFAEKMVTIAKKQNLAARRQLISELRSPETANILISRVAGAFKSRNGGYTRVLKTKFREGDGAQLAILEFTADYELPGRTGKKKEKKGKVAPEKTKAEKPKAEKPTEAKEGEAAKEKGEEETDEKKSSGFLGSLRGFLKGE